MNYKKSVEAAIRDQVGEQLGKADLDTAAGASQGLALLKK